MLRPALVVALACSLLVVVVLSSPSASSPIRGVAPSDQPKFQSSDFFCVVGGQSEYLPISRVNDEFCDCDDGDDEPGTAACSYVMTSAFYCANDGFFAKKIHTSRIHDGVCDCCDGSDEEIEGASACPNSCAAAAEAFRRDAKQRLEVVRSGFEQRRAILKEEVAPYFEQLKESETMLENELAALKLLRDRVTVHKEREELRETRYRLAVARQKHEGKSGYGDERVEESKEQSLDTAVEDAVEVVEFEALEAVQLADDEASIDSAEDERALEMVDAIGYTVKSLIELPDGTSVSLAEYLRMDHSNFQASTKKWTPCTAGGTWRECLLVSLINGEAEGRGRLGLTSLRVIGVIVSPLRAFVEVLLYSPRVLWRVLSTPETAGPVIDKFTIILSPLRSAWFRQLGGGSVFDAYSLVIWAAQVVWDAPIYAYHYLFPTLDGSTKLPEAESLRKVLSEIQSDISKLERDRSGKRAAASADYGPDRAYFVLKDKCIEKRIEKYNYKFCAFGDVKQDHTTLGKWDGWATKDDNELSSDAAADYTRMWYSKGHRCYNGPERSVSVNLECGDVDEILSVDEPSTCVYVMAVRSTLACTAQVLAKVEEEVAL